MDDTKTTRSNAPVILEWVIGVAVAAALIIGAWLAMQGKLHAGLVLWSSASIVASAVGGFLVYVVAAIAGAVKVYD